MADVMSSEKRSAVMSNIRGKDTRPEIEVRRALWHNGFRYRLHAKELPGRPDIVLPRWKASIFVHGCFWHRHEGCSLFQLPATRPEFWDAKLSANNARGNRAVRALADAGWRVLVVWECALKLDTSSTTRRVIAWVRSQDRCSELLRVGARVRRNSMTLTSKGPIPHYRGVLHTAEVSFVGIVGPVRAPA